ncbi:hypothetical protein GOP47_0011883 [Adiantum capillus-veneris]|uniref:AAA+ ATPase domain-containing protein n=1 Tax=Adiantum capillus-veneris TaxID=13818 RepID=A0A9D4ZI38_ADICA|nr:hypothetical protein GOP47_0011883 [Adiantum capillus-veneris]
MDAGKTALSVMGACAFGLTFVPHPLRAKLDSCLRDLWVKLFSTADPFAYIEVPRKSKAGPNASVRHNSNAYARIASACNPFYSEVGLYLGSLNIEFATRRVCLYGMDLADDLDRPISKFFFGLPLDETLIDTFEGVQFSWTHTIASDGKHSSSHDQNNDDANDVFTLRMLKSDKRHLLHPYLNHITRVAHEIRQQNTLPILYTNGTHGSHWSPVTLKHPSTFDTIALDGDLAERIQADLKAFSESEAYYHSIGRAWKRGYLLYGPPGTGKSSLIAAISNYMHYDIYDLELTNVFNNSSLQSLLMQTTRKSIIVIEDIDCATIKGISERQKGHHEYSSDKDDYEETPSSNSRGFTLSGLLNFADGLLSCYGEERIFIFTTNHKERLDSALLRCGRMDMHIHLSYCTFSVFKQLAVTYLGVKNHALYGELEEAMKPGVNVTPASIAEILISERKVPDEAIKQVLAAVKARQPLGVESEEKLTAGGAESAERLENTTSNVRIRKYLDGDLAGTFCEGSARKKRQTSADVCAADPPIAKDTGLWSSEEESEEDGQDIRTAAVVEQRIENGKDTLLSRLQSGQVRESADEGVERLTAGEKPEVSAATNATHRKGQTFDAGYDQHAREAVQARSDLNAANSDGGVWQGMMINDSEDSSDGGSQKLDNAHLIPFKAAIAVHGMS